MKRLIFAGLLTLGACGITANQSSQINAVLTRIGNTLTTDLNTQISVANAATPPDTAGADCGRGALTVAAAIQKVAAASAGKPIGAFTAGEIASLYQPGSPQFNWAVTTLETACIAKIHQVNQAVNSTAGIIAALPSVLALAALPVGA